MTPPFANLGRDFWLRLVLGSFFIVFAIVATAGPAISKPAVIAWTPARISEILTLGETKTISVTFNSTKNLRHASVQVSPELAPFVHPDPVSLERIRKGKSRQLNLVLSAPVGTTPGIATGTIQLQKGREEDRDEDDEKGEKEHRAKTLVGSLPVTVEVWSIFAQPALGVRLIVPPGFVTTQLPHTPVLSPGLGATVATFRSQQTGSTGAGPDGPVAGCLIQLGIEDNSAHLSIQEWVARQYRRPDDVDETIVVQGRQAIQRSGHGEIFGNPFSAVFIPDGNRVLSLDFLADPDTEAQCRENLQIMLRSLQMGP